jgi:hypothetical protein
MKTRNLILAVLLAYFAFGGTFTCTSTNDSEKHTENPTTPVRSKG